MKRLLIIIGVLILSCKKQEVSSSKINLPEVKEAKPKVSDWDKFENEVFQTIEAVEKTDGKEKRKNILRFISFRDRVDGAIAEGYCNFAFEYVENNPKDFYSVLAESDSTVINEWSSISSSEVGLIGENTNGIDSIWADIKNNHRLKRQNLNSVEVKMDELYVRNLEIEIRKN